MIPDRKVLIAESGASKTAWRLCNRGQVLASLESIGLNPSSLSKKDLNKTLEEVIFQLKGEEIHKVCFYGAGLKFEQAIRLLKLSLAELLPEAEIEVEDDLTAAIRSTGKKEGVVCILGTGSNACLYNADGLVKNLGGHGYLLGDEGSGMDLGKHLLKGCLDGNFPQEISAFLEEQEGMSLGEIRTSVYQSLQPNKRLASFAPYLNPWRNNPEIAAMIQGRFKEFLFTTVIKLPDRENLSLDFVGGIAANFSAEIEKVCKELGLAQGSYIESPIERLITYHANPYK